MSQSAPCQVITVGCWRDRSAQTLASHIPHALLLLLLSGTIGCEAKGTASHSPEKASNRGEALRPPHGADGGASAGVTGPSFSPVGGDDELGAARAGDADQLLSDGEDDDAGADDELNAARADDVDQLRSDAEDLSWEIRRLRRNADQYSHDEFATRLRRLEAQAGDLSSQAGSSDLDEAEGELEELESNLRKSRRSIEDDPRYYYREREDEIDSDLRRRESEAEDAASTLDDANDE